MGEATDAKQLLTRFATAVRSGDWPTVESLLDPKTGWYVGNSSPFAGEYSGAGEVVALLKRVAEKAFDRGGAKTDDAEILVGDHHHGIFWFFTAEVDGEKRSSYEIWLADLSTSGTIGAVFFFAEDAEMAGRFWA